MDFAKLKKKSIKRKFEYEGEQINYEIKGGFLTPSFIHVLTNLGKENDYNGLAKNLANAIIKWDLDWEGEPFPPSYETLSARCPIEFVMAIVEDMSAVFTDGDQPQKG